MKTKKGLSTLLSAMLMAGSLLITGCGSSGSGSTSQPATATISGTAAVGYPVIGGAINVSCAAGSALSATTSSTGDWQVTISGQTLPCAVQVAGGTINGAANATSYHSIATAFGTVNVTPLTDLMVANMAGAATPGTWFAGLTPAMLTAITQTNVDAALANLRTALGLTPLNTINPITTAFTPAPGNISDNMLTALSAAMTSASVTYANLLSNASATTFVAPAGFGTALTTAYAGTTSGGTGGGAGVCGDTTSIDSFFTSNKGFINVSRTGGNTTSGLYQQLSNTDGYRVQIHADNTGAKSVFVTPVDSGSTIHSLAVGPEDVYEDLAKEVNVLFNAAPAQPQVGLTGVLQCDKTTGTWTLAIAAANSATNNVTLTSGKGGGGSNVGPLSCDTTKYTPGAVRIPTAAELAAFAATYNGQEGYYGSKLGDPFVASGTATLVFGADGATTYNGASYTLASACFEAKNASGGTSLYLMFGNGHIDLFSGGTWSGLSPNDTPGDGKLLVIKAS